MKSEQIQISPLARAYLDAVRAGQLSQADVERQLADAAAYILRHGVAGTAAGVLRVVGALCEAVAKLKNKDVIDDSMLRPDFTNDGPLLEWAKPEGAGGSRDSADQISLTTN